MAKAKSDKNGEEKETSEKKLMSIDQTLAALKKQFGENSAQILGKSTNSSTLWVPLPGPALTDALGKGYPRGRTIEIYGQESSGKTSLATHIAAETQKYFFEDKQRNGIVAYIDVEHAFETKYALSFGLDLNKVIFSQPDSAEQALDMAIFLAETEAVDLIILDSVAALVPQAEIDSGVGDANMAVVARLMSRSCRKLTSIQKQTGTTTIFINQTRVALGAWVPAGAPPKEEPTGGKALRFYASIRMEVKRRETIEVKSKPIGIISSVTIRKNKVSTPFKKIELVHIWGKGFDFEPEYFEFFKRYGVIQGSGWYSFTGENGEAMRIQGEDKVQAYLKEFPEVKARMKLELRERMLEALEKEAEQNRVEALPTGDESEDEIEEIVDEEEAIAESAPVVKLTPDPVVTETRTRTKVEKMPDRSGSITRPVTLVETETLTATVSVTEAVILSEGVGPGVQSAGYGEIRSESEQLDDLLGSAEVATDGESETVYANLESERRLDFSERVHLIATEVGERPELDKFIVATERPMGLPDEGLSDAFKIMGITSVDQIDTEKLHTIAERIRNVEDVTPHPAFVAMQNEPKVVPDPVKLSEVDIDVPGETPAEKKRRQSREWYQRMRERKALEKPGVEDELPE